MSNRFDVENPSQAHFTNSNRKQRKGILRNEKKKQIE